MVVRRDVERGGELGKLNKGMRSEGNEEGNWVKREWREKRRGGGGIEKK